MSYKRVIPRDLFNEANLLFCLGSLVLKLETLQGHSAQLSLVSSDDDWHIHQNPDDGSITARGVEFLVGGEQYALYRPLNSREKYPLYCEAADGEIAVFTASGSITREFSMFIETKL